MAIIASLPNELSLDENIKLVKEFVNDNFIDDGMCAIAAIHNGKNKDPMKNNPHVHILLTTRSASLDGFNIKKNRDWDKKENILIWRERWANIQNRSYERRGLDIRVSHESNIARGIDREARKHLNRFDYELERRGERTDRGDENRAIYERNLEREERIEHDRQRQLNRNRVLERSR